MKINLNLNKKKNTILYQSIITILSIINLRSVQRQLKQQAPFQWLPQSPDAS